MGEVERGRTRDTPTGACRAVGAEARVTHKRALMRDFTNTSIPPPKRQSAAAVHYATAPNTPWN